MRIKLLAAALLFAASASFAEKKKMTIQEWKGANGGPAEAGNQVIGDAAAWTALWKTLGKDAPIFNFKKSIAVAVFVGQKPTGGYSPVFEEPVAQGDDVLIRYRVPKPSGFVTQAFTQPWRIRAYPRPKGKVILGLVE